MPHRRDAWQTWHLLKAFAGGVDEGPDQYTSLHPSPLDPGATANKKPFGMQHTERGVLRVSDVGGGGTDGDWRVKPRERGPLWPLS